MYQKLNHYVLHLKLIFQINYVSIKKYFKVNVGGQAQAAWGIGREDHFPPPANSSKDNFNAEQIPQNNFWTLTEDTRHPERQPILFERR